jgi:uncharacterized membrane protein (DUF4010 family)
MDIGESAIRLAVATLGGLAVGVEREWSIKASGRAARFAGVRTFALLGLLGGISVELQSNNMAAAGICLLAGAALVVVFAYAVTAYQNEVDGTTEVAALIVLASGALAGTGRLGLASAINALTAFILVEKTRIHSLVFRLQSEELSAAFRFAVLALVVLPILPTGPFGPSPGIRPRELWGMVLIFSGLSFTGYLARRIVGPNRGYEVAGLLGGLVSSTAVSLTYSNESRSQPKMARSLAIGVLAACTMLLFRAPILAFILNPQLGISLIPYLWIPAFIGIVLIVIALLRKDSGKEDAPLPKNPLRLLAAIEMAVVFQVVLFLVNWADTRFGSRGILTSSALLGLTDVDALTFSLSKIATSNNLNVTAEALAVGILSNTILKIGIILVVGRNLFRRYATLGLLALAAGSVAGLFFFWK